MDKSRYLELEKELLRIRGINSGNESEEEKSLLEEMDEVWSNLSQEDRVSLTREH